FRFARGEVGEQGAALARSHLDLAARGVLQSKASQQLQSQLRHGGPCFLLLSTSRLRATARWGPLERGRSAVAGNRGVWLRCCGDGIPRSVSTWGRHSFTHFSRLSRLRVHDGPL